MPGSRIVNASITASALEVREEGPTVSRKRSRNQSSPETTPIKPQTPIKWRSPRRRADADKNCEGDVSTDAKIVDSPRKSPRKRLSDQLSQKTKWNPRDPAQMQAVKEALHVATSPTNIVCREEEQRKVLDFCKGCIEREKAGSLYVCGCPGTGKTMSIERVKELILVWSKERGYQLLDMIAINCTSLANTSDIFSKILENFRPHKKMNGSFSPLQHLQTLFSQKGQLTSRRMILLVIDEMDYLITRDRSVLHDLFMLTTFPFSRCILVGIANAIDLADRFLPKLESLNCKPSIITFRAYSADQILKILQQRLMVLGYDVFQPSALEFCARKVAAASGDMRRALGVCRSAIELLEAELRDTKKEFNLVGFNHMELALSKAFKSAVVDTIQSLPQHQQIILCSLVKLFRQSKKNGTTVGELNKSYIGICKSTQVPAVGMLEFTSMCGVLSDQGLLKLGNSREDRLKRVTLQIDSSDIIFAFKGYRFFQSCLED
ncbi:uncharacterized protein A4U43_C02F170 [Asparagus officinalis]|uniref:Cell division control protein n=1 Tax=Asparagus officinalis TaxID=4686 RepID=A0A5P1FJQ9_ASPOF|nr:cell division control protein 6 homolog [Asparagus officinalis]ONK76820.1 uncharacterized protein A4U43_C02F170 [Asparagus officinalis]